MRRSEVWTVAGGAGYSGKPRPAVIIQDDSFIDTASVTVCLFTSDETDAPLIRLPVAPTERNGLKRPSRLMIDKLVTVPRGRLGDRLGKLDEEDMLRLSRAVLVFLGLAVPLRAPPSS